MADTAPGNPCKDQSKPLWEPRRRIVPALRPASSMDMTTPRPGLSPYPHRISNHSGAPSAVRVGRSRHLAFPFWSEGNHNMNKVILYASLGMALGAIASFNPATAADSPAVAVAPQYNTT